MSENYFYSSLSAQEIEDTLVGAVVGNAAQSFTTSQKAQARANIGAGAVDTGLVIKGFYETAADLESAHPIAAEGDVYMVGTEAPYDTYIWDAVNMEWKNDGALTPGDSTIDDNDISTTHTWSSSKINTQLGGKQAAITATGMLKGTGSAVQAATLGSDYTAVDDSSSESTTKTWSITKILQAIAGFVSFAVAQTLTDAQKSQARANIGAERSWTLVWTNQSPSSDFAAQTVQVDLSAYSEIKIQTTLNNSQLAYFYYDIFNIDGLISFINHVFNIQTDSNAYFAAVARVVTASSTGIVFGDATVKDSNVSSKGTTANIRLVPIKIWAR